VNTFNILWSNVLTLLCFLILPDLLFKTILTGFIILFSYMCIKELWSYSYSTPYSLFFPYLTLGHTLKTVSILHSCQKVFLHVREYVCSLILFNIMISSSTHFHIYIYIHVHIHIYTYTYICTYTYIYIHIHTYAYIYMHMYMSHIFFFFKLFIYSHVHTLLGPFLPPAPASTLFPITSSLPARTRSALLSSSVEE
jgi:hypothetical protein